MTHTCNHIVGERLERNGTWRTSCRMCGKSVIVAEGVGHLFIDDRDIAREANGASKGEDTSYTLMPEMRDDELHELIQMALDELKRRHENSLENSEKNS